MATQTYTPQPGAPISNRLRKFEPALNLPEIVAIATLPGEMADSQYGASEVKFRLVDGRPWFVPQIIADEIYRARIAPRQQIEVTKTGRSKSELTIVPLPAHLGGGAAQTAPHASTPTAPQTQHNSNASAPAAPRKLSPATACMCASMMSAVEAVMETQAYAASKGLGLTFSEESVRAIGLSIYISECKGGRS